MTRQRIEIAPGTLAPTARGLWSAAREKLHEAKLGIAQMQKARDRIEFEGGWTRFVDSTEEFWSRFFDEGKSRFSSFQPWAGAIDAERKKDPLLQYLYQARHQSQHGRITLEWEEGHLQIAPGFSGHIKSLRVYPDGSFEMDFTPAHSSVRAPRVVFSAANARLPTVINQKYNQKFQPPKEHLGAPVADMSPVGVASLGLEYYFKVLDRAFDKF